MASNVQETAYYLLLTAQVMLQTEGTGNDLIMDTVWGASRRSKNIQCQK